ncbi:MAG TPA: hypothetical protein VK585_02730 [Jiangellaceae bacterium]|nr:hypothetical protein [Jiangellaceae bacterium]
MRRKTKIAIATTALAGGAVAGTAAFAAAGGADDDTTQAPISGSALDQATDAALEHTGGGRVTGTEVGDEEGFYEVEVILDNGSQVDVHLDEAFNVISGEGDNESETGDD